MIGRLEVVVSLLLLLGTTPPLAAERFEYSDVQMGIVFRLVLHSESKETADTASTAVFARLAELNHILSDWEKDSELNRLVRGAAGVPHLVSGDLFYVLQASLHYSRLSGGAFDVTSGPLVSLWRLAGARGKFPETEDLAAVRRRVGFSLLELKSTTREVQFSTEGIRIDLGGIAKGYALDEALKVLAGFGIRRALVDGGGDILVGDPPPGRAGWSVAIAGDSSRGDPERVLELSHTAVASSGDTQQSWLIEGTRYSHIVDPRTGRALTRAARATVIARTGIEADALATALCVMEPETGLALLEQLQGACAEIVRRSPQGLEFFSSECFLR